MTNALLKALAAMADRPSPAGDAVEAKVPMSPRERQRRYRQRRKAGRLVLKIEVDEVEIAEALRELKFLGPLCDDHAEIERAVAELLKGIASNSGRGESDA